MNRAALEIGDGLDALRKEIGLREIASLIERTARWVSPDTFKLLPLWYPEYARRAFFYNANVRAAHEFEPGERQLDS